MISEDFQEIAHCGGKLTIVTKKNESGELSLRFRYTNSGTSPGAIFGVYATFDRCVTDTIQLGGMGLQWNPPSDPQAVPVFIASDNQGYYGHYCQGCQGYWRSKNAQALWLMTCPYCGLKQPTHCFLTEGQFAYIEEFLNLFNSVLERKEEGEFSIDMDDVAKRVANKEIPKPSFYYTEESQQNKYKCAKCNSEQDILGRFGYCSCCGLRNDLQMLQQEIEAIRKRINENVDDTYSNRVKEAVSAFDTLGLTYAKQLLLLVPMTKSRKQKLQNLLFHNLETCSEFMRNAFDIDLFKKMKDEEVTFSKLMFERRQLYEHKGGEVDQKYLDRTGDTTVRLKQAITETQENAHKLCTNILKLAQSFHDGFHDIFPPIECP